MILDPDFGELLLKLFLALIAGGLIGMERERRERPAGLRTHILVCLGSTLITLVSMRLSPAGDPGRIAAQIVSGIGFLGAGTIFRSASGITGLTTAAGLWVVAGIGMAIGAGSTLLVLALVTTLMVWVVNRWVRLLEDHLVRNSSEIRLTTSRQGDVLARVFEGLEERGIAAERVEWLEEDADETTAVVRLRVRTPTSERAGELTGFLSDVPGVRRVEWE